MNEHHFRGTRRFQLRRPLGFGGMGVVYQAYDRERDMDVALKVLIGVGPQAIRSLKREFRALADVSHPNLIGFFDLINDEHTWFITMELVDGDDVITHLRGARGQSFRPPTQALARAGDITRPARRPQGSVPEERAPAVQPGVVDMERLRPVFVQLARAVSAVHGMGRLHCDIKPSNVLVSRENRVVLLDFGLAVELRLRGDRANAASPMAGTPSYVAPEQWRGEEGTAASDWYSVGVMLYEALTGHLPFVGDTDHIQSAKERSAFDDAALAASAAPPELKHLCQRLLAPLPRDRASESEVMAVLGSPATETATAVAKATSTAERFVGRTRELELLARAHRRSAAGAAVIVRLEGPSGIGKTALARQFMSNVRAASPALVLKGRCYERESIPFKALDTIVETLASHLSSIDKPEAMPLPEDAVALVRLFPVLREIPWLAPPLDDDIQAQEPLRLRQRAAIALRALLAHVCGHRGLVVCIDDAQWGDADSAELLSALLESPDPPPLLLLLVHRSDVPTPGVLLSRLDTQRNHAAPVLHVPLAPLSELESIELAAALLNQTADVDTATEVAREAKGNPFFLTELTRFCLERAAPGPGAILAVTLEEVLRRRLSLLPRAARRLLEVIAVAGKPIRQRLAEASADLHSAEATSMGLLRATHFVRTFGPGEADPVETFHDRVREALLAALDPPTRRDHHRRLAESAEAAAAAEGGTDEPDFLAEHFLASGIRDKAFNYTVAAARRARTLYALHDSVRHWENAMTLLAEDSTLVSSIAGEQQLRREHADALRNAGLFDRAIAALAICRERTPDATDRALVGLDLGRVFQEMGRPEDAIRDLEEALALLGKRVPPSAPRLIAATLMAAVSQGLRRCLPELFRNKPPTESVKRQLLALLVLLRIYFFVDRRKLGWGILTSLRLARGIDDAITRARIECYYVAGLLGLGALPRAQTASRRGALADGTRDGLARALTQAHVGMCALFANDLAQAKTMLGEAAAGLERAGEYWELQAWRHMQAVSMFLSAQFEEAERTWERVADHARAASSRPHLGWTLAWLPLCRYTSGKIDGATATAEIQRAHDLSQEVEDVANQLTALMNAAIIAVREENAEEAARLAIRTFDAVDRYHVQIPFVQRALVDAAEAALYALEHGAVRERRRALEAIVRRAFRSALKTGRTYTYLRGPALRVKARHVALTRGAEAAEPVFREAIATLEATPNHLDLVVALHDAAVAVPSLRATALPRARRIAGEIGASVELARLARVSSAII